MIGGLSSCAGGERLGWVDVQPRGSGRGNVAYGVVARHRNCGFATRSVALAARYGFDVLHWSRLEILVNADNAASRAVAHKAGFQLEGILRSYCAFERFEPLIGRRADYAIYARIRADD